MRFRSIHTVVTYLIAALGLTAIAIGGVLHPLAMGAAFLAAAASSVAAREPLISRRWYARAWTVGLGLALALEALRVATGTSPIEAGIELAILLQINRLWSLRSAREHGQVVVLALVHLIAASVLDQGISYGALFAGFVLVLPWAMTLSHLRSEIEGGARPTDPKGQRAHVERVLASRRIVGPRFLAATALLALPIFVTSAALFVLFPRVGLGFLGGGPRSRVSVAGFSDEVRLGDHGLIRDDATVVLRFELDPLPSPPPARLGVHFRGAAYDAYDGRQWTRTPALAAGQEMEREGDRYCLTRACGVRGGRRTVYRVYLEDLDPPVLMIPPGAAAVLMAAQRRGTWLVRRPLYLSPLQEVRREEESTLVVHYSVETAPGEAGMLARRERRLEPYLQTPELDPRVGELARRLTAPAGGDPLRAAELVASHLGTAYGYSLDLRGASDDRPLEDFLFVRRTGHCEYFSTAMAILLRTVGVPTRNVTGFLGGRLNRFGVGNAFYTVSQSDAHSWVEVYVEDRGWVAFDPTPSGRPGGAGGRSVLRLLAELLDAGRLAWDKNVVAYDLESQMGLFGSAWRTSRAIRYGLRGQTTRGARAEPRAPLPWLATGLGAAGLIVALVLWRRWRRRGPRRGRRRGAGAAHARAASLVRRLDAALARGGAPRPPSRTPADHVTRLAEQGHPAASPAAEVVARYNVVRFGGDRFAAGEEARLGELVRLAERLGRAHRAA